MSSFIFTLISLVSIAFAQTGNTVGYAPTGIPSAGFGRPSGILASGIPVPSGYSGAGNSTACPPSINTLCFYPYQVTYCYDASNVLYTVTCGIAFTGETADAEAASEKSAVKRDASTSLVDCQGACDSSSACLGVDFDAHSCTLLSTVTGITTTGLGSVGAWKGYWAGGAPTINGTEPSLSNTTVPANSATSSLTSSSPTSSTAASADLPSISANSSSAMAGPTAPSTGIVYPSGVSPSGSGLPSGVYPTGSTPSGGSISSCSLAGCTIYGASVRFCHDEGGHIYTINCGMKFTGTLMPAELSLVTLPACEESCDATQGCLAVNFDQEAQECTLVSRVTGVDYPAPGVIAAWRGYWAGGAPSANFTIPSNSTGNSSMPVGTGASPSIVSAWPTISANATNSSNATTAGPTAMFSSSVPLVTAGTSGFPTLSLNSSGVAVGPTAFPSGSRPSGVFPTGGFPSGVFPVPTGSFPYPSASSGNDSYSSCSETACTGEGATYCKDTNGQVYTLNCGLKFEGTVGSTIPSTSLGYCELSCDALPRCLAFNYGQGGCQFMYTVSGVDYPAPGYVAAWRGFWAGGAPSSNSSNTTSLPSNGTASSSVNSTSVSTSSLVLTTGFTSSSIAPVAGTSGFASISSNGSNSIVGPTAFPSGIFPSGSRPSGVFSSGFPSPSGSPGNSSYASCAATTCTAGGAEFCTDSDGQLYTLNCGMKFTGTISSSIANATGLEDCAATCDVTPRCLAYNFGNSECSFLSAVTGVDYPAPGYIAAWRGYWAGGAPEQGNTTSFAANSSTLSTTSSVSVPLVTGMSSTVTASSNDSSSPTVFRSASSTASVSLGTATSGLPSISVNSTFPVGPTGFASGIFPTGAAPTGLATNGPYPSCIEANCDHASGAATFCTDASGQLYTLNCGMKFKGTVTSTTHNATGLEDCAATCDLQPRCLALNYESKQCEFLSIVTGIDYPAPGYTAAWRGYWDGGAPSFSNETVPVANATAPVNATSPAQNTTSASSTLISPSVVLSTAASTSALASTSLPVPSSNSSSVASSTSSGYATSASGFPITTGTPSNGSSQVNSTYPLCSATPNCLAAYQEIYCSDESNQLYTVTCGIAFTGTYLSDKEKRSAADGKSTLLDCERSCDSSAACIALNYDGSNCAFLSSVTGVESLNGSVAAWRGYWNGGAPSNQTGGLLPSNSTGPFNVTLPSASVPSTNATASSAVVGPVSTNATSTSLLSSTSSVVVSSTASSLVASSASLTTSSVISTTSILLSTSSPAQPSVNGTYTTCDRPATAFCTSHGIESNTLCQDATGQVYTITCAVEFLGPSMANLTAPSLFACEAECDSTAGCVALNYVNGSLCGLVSSIYGVIDVPGSIAAYRGLWVGGAPSGFNGTTGRNESTATAPLIPSASAPAQTSTASDSSTNVIAPTKTVFSSSASVSASNNDNVTTSVPLTSTSNSETSYTTFTSLCTDNGR